MNRLEANVSLLAITFFAAIQYVFLSQIPASVSAFAFLSVTNFIGLLFTLAFFARELYRLDRRQLLQSLVLAGELFGFNVFLLMGSNGMDASVVSCIITAYFAFIPLLMLLTRQKVRWNSGAGIVLVLAGVFMVLGTDSSYFNDPHIILLVAADAFFAVYMMTVERFCGKSNPSILAMGQMFFGFLISFAVWVVQSLVYHRPMTLPVDSNFWCSVIFISLFIRGLYGVVQIYAQRYVTALNASLIFSTEVVITLLISPLMSRLMGTPVIRIGWLKLVGCLVIVAGVLLADGSLLQFRKRRRRNEV